MSRAGGGAQAPAACAADVGTCHVVSLAAMEGQAPAWGSCLCPPNQPLHPLPLCLRSFMATLREYKQGSLDEAGVAHRMRLLLAGHPDLLAGFGQFLSRVGAPVVHITDACFGFEE